MTTALGPLLHESREGRIDLARVLALNDQQPTPERAAPSCPECSSNPTSRVDRIPHERNQRGLGNQLMQHLDVLLPHLARQQFTPVTFLPGREALNEPGLNRDRRRS